MTGRDPLDLEFVIERRSHLLHLLRRRYDQMNAASDSVKLRVDRGGVLKYLLDARMRASHHDSEPLRRLDRQRHLVHIACARLFGDGGQYEESLARAGATRRRFQVLLPGVDGGSTRAV